jgi:hypothetical protein
MGSGVLNGGFRMARRPSGIASEVASQTKSARTRRQWRLKNQGRLEACPVPQMSLSSLPFLSPTPWALISAR